MSTPSTTVSIIPLGTPSLLSKTAVTIPVGGIVQIQTDSLDANGNHSGQLVNLTSNNTGVAKVTGSERGFAPANVQGVAPGVVLITASPADNAALTASITVTVQ